MSRARRGRRDQERKARRKRKTNNKDSDANDDANSLSIQLLQQRSEAAETAPNGDDESAVISVDAAVAGDSVAATATGQDVTSKEEEKQTTAANPNPATKLSKQEQQRLKMQKRKEQHKAKKSATALAAQQVEEERKCATQALAQMQSRQKQEEQLLRQNKFVPCAKGVQYCEIRTGTGSLLKQEEVVSVQYVLRAKNKRGKILESNNHFEFQLGKGNVIEGWDIGMEGMRRGGARRLIVPKDAGYADKDIGAGIEADLYFEIEVHL